MCKPDQSNILSRPLSASCSSHDDKAFVIPTFREGPAQRQLDISSLSSSDLDELRASDPFMYYSIPAEEVKRRNSQVSSGGGSAGLNEGGAVVTRRSCVSVERCGDLEGLMQRKLPGSIIALDEDVDLEEDYTVPTQGDEEKLDDSNVEQDQCMLDVYTCFINALYDE